MCGWVMTIGEMLMRSRSDAEPVACRHLHQADETPVDVQMHDGSGTTIRLTSAVRNTRGMTVFDFRMSRKREGPLNFLGNFEDSPNRWLRRI